MSEQELIPYHGEPMQLKADRPWLTMMPGKVVAPLVLEEQIKEIDSPPGELQYRKIGEKDVAYLGHDYVEKELYRIFGTRNILVVQDPTYPRDGVESKTSKGDAIIPIMSHILLVVRWADGEVSHYEGWGEMNWQPKNSQVSKANVIRGSLSYATTDAAKRIGPHFGSGLKSMLDAGLADEIRAKDAAATIQEIVESGTRIFATQNDSDRILDDEALDQMALHFCRKPYAETDAKQKQVLLVQVEHLPTIDERLERIDAIRGAGLEVDDDITIAGLRILERQLRAKR